MVGGEEKLGAQVNCDSNLVVDLLEREKNCNSSNSGYSGKHKIFEFNFSSELEHLQDTLLTIVVLEAHLRILGNLIWELLT